MKYNRTDYSDFLNRELNAQIADYENKVKQKARVLKENGEVFVGKFLKMQADGQAIFKVRNNSNLPRRNSFWTATYFIAPMERFANWGEHSWLDLRRDYQRDFCDAHCAWVSPSDDPNFYLVGISQLSVDLVEILEKEKPIIAFGPKDPPLQYLYNLLEIVNDTTNSVTLPILNFEERPGSWSPQKVEAKTDFTTILLHQLSTTNTIVIQGPPGTGKTYRMAQLTARLLSHGKSVLVTALTNQALMELAKKEDIEPFLNDGRVSKTSLTIDETKALPKLQRIIDNKCNASPGRLTLASFYVSSGWAVEAKQTKPFDYVIMDEASQAFLPMIAATQKLGKQVIWIGDQCQLSPIVLINDDIIATHNWKQMISGFETICENFCYKSYLLSDTFRLTQRGAECTGVFYDNKLCSVSNEQSVNTNIDILNKKGGPTIIELPLSVGDKTTSVAEDYIKHLIITIFNESPKAEIAILAKFRNTIKSIQRLPSSSQFDNVIIETVDRVQGLTVDYCIFLIPNVSIKYSLDAQLFNVATSRARKNTIIIVPQSIMDFNMPLPVRQYLQKAMQA